MNDAEFAEATPIDKVWEEIANGTFVDGFSETSGCHPLPPEVLAHFFESSERIRKLNERAAENA